MVLLFSITENFGFFILIILVVFFQIIKPFWNWRIAGTIYGKVVFDNRTILPDVMSDIKLTCGKLHKKKPYSQTITNISGEFHFNRKVPLGSKLRITADFGDKKISHTVDQIEGVKWLFGVSYFGLPISTGNAKRVDFTILPE